MSSSFSRYAGRAREFIALCGITERVGPADHERRFDELARELFALQFAHNPPYAALCRARGRTPEQVGHWREIPAVPTSAFKEFELTTLVPEARTAVFHSSGTTEQRPSRHFHDAESLALYEASLRPWFARHFLADRDEDAFAARPLDFISFTPPPGQAPHSSLVHMFVVILRDFGGPASFFAGANVDDGWSLDFAKVLSALRDAVAANRPVALLGTAFNFVHLLDWLAMAGLRLTLPPGSRALETGGYKGRSRTLPKAELHALIAQRLGLAADHIVTEYGMSELSSQAYDLAIPASANPPSRTTHHASGSFCFPPWCRAQVVSPEHGREVAEGEIGCLRFCDLANLCSVLAIQTEDLAVRRGEGFELHGRPALAEPRGCSRLAA